MKSNTKLLLIAAFIALALPLTLPGGNAPASETASYCLSCHKPMYLWPQDDKTSFTDTGHFKMLRVVTPGTELLGPDGQHYTDPGFNWSAGTYTYKGTTYKMAYIFGGWLGFDNIFGNAANPGVVDNTGMIVGSGIPYVTSCATCHTTGTRWWGADGTYNEVLAFNYDGTLSTSYPTVSAGSGTVYWDENGVSCERCHYYQKRLGSNWWDFNDMWPFYVYTSPIYTSAGDTSTNALCGKCHQGRYDNGFMNSPHARFRGAWAQLADPSQYNSDFIRHYGGGCTECHDVHKTLIGDADASKPWWGGAKWNSPGREEVNATYCSDSSVSSNDANLAADCAAAGGTVVTQEGAVKNCVACHNGNSGVKTINHTAGPGTPFTVYPYGGATDPTDACYVCHMPSGRHLFRINPDPNYSYIPQDATTCIISVPGGYGSWTPNCSLPAGTSWTSTTCATVGGAWNSATSTCTPPTATCTSIGGTWDATTGACTGTLVLPSPFVTSTTCASVGAALHVTATYSPGCTDTRDGSAAGKATSDGTWQYAQWNDLDMSCGQCHGGSGGQAATANGAPYFTKDQLAGVATSMHESFDYANTANSVCLACHGDNGTGTTSLAPPAPNIIPGTNHHGQHARCTWCHSQAPHNGTPAATMGETYTSGGTLTAYGTGGPSSNAFCLKCHSNSGAYGKHHSVASVANIANVGCTNCHKIDGTGVVPPPGVSVPNSDDTNNNCLACHQANDFGAPTSTLTPAVSDIWAIGSVNHVGTTVCTECHYAGTYRTMELVSMPSTSNTFVNTVCGRCHGGDTNNTNNAPYIATADLIPYAAIMHGVPAGTKPPTASSTITAANDTFAVGSLITLTDASSDPVTAQESLSVTVDWGDGSQSTGVGGGTFTHTYSIAGTFAVIDTVTNSAGLSASRYTQEVISAASQVTSISGTVYNSFDTSVPAAGVKVKLKNAAGMIKQTVITDASGSYAFTNVSSPATQAYTIIARDPNHTRYSYTSATVTSGTTLPATSNLNLAGFTIAVSGGTNYPNAKVTVSGSKTMTKWTSTIMAPYIARFNNLHNETWSVAAMSQGTDTTQSATCTVSPSSVDPAALTLTPDDPDDRPTVSVNIVSCP